MTSTKELQNKLSELVNETPEYGDLGLQNANGTFTYDAHARPGWVYYRTRRGGMQTLDIAQDGGVARVPGLPVKIERDSLGRKIIRAGSLDPTRLTRYLGTSSPPVVIGRHSHEIGYGNEDWVQSKRLKAGQVRVNVDLTATISDFYYVYAGTHYYFPQTIIDLSTHLPSTPGDWWWTKICFEPISNDVTVLEGTSTSTAIPLMSTDLADIALTGLLLPLAGIKLRESQTTIGQESDTEACWPWTGTTEVTIPGSYIFLQDQQTQNTDAGTFTSGARRTRTLNTIVVDTTGGVTLSSDQFVLLAGTYRINAQAPCFAVDRNRIWLRNITDSTDTLIGLSNHCDSANGGFGRADLNGRFTISGTKTFEIQHRCETTQATYGLGVATNFDVEIYTTVELIKE